MFMYEHACMLVHGYACIYSLEPTYNSHVAHRGFCYRIFVPEWLDLTYNPYLHRNNVKTPPPESILYTMGLNYKINNISVTSRSGGHGQFRAEQFLQIPDICPVTINTIIVVFWMGNATHRLLCLNAWYPSADRVLEGGVLWALQN